MCLFNLFLHGYSSLGFAFKKLLIKVNNSFFSLKLNHKRSWLRQIQTYLFWPCFAKNFHIAWLGRWTHISLLCIGFVVVCRPQIRLLYMTRREFVIQERGLRRPLYLWSASTTPTRNAPCPPPVRRRGLSYHFNANKKTGFRNSTNLLTLTKSPGSLCRFSLLVTLHFIQRSPSCQSVRETRWRLSNAHRSPAHFIWHAHACFCVSHLTCPCLLLCQSYDMPMLASVSVMCMKTINSCFLLLRLGLRCLASLIWRQIHRSVDAHRRSPTPPSHRLSLPPNPFWRHLLCNVNRPLAHHGNAANLEDKTNEIFSSGNWDSHVKKYYCSVLQIGRCIPTDGQGVDCIQTTCFISLKAWNWRRSMFFRKCADTPFAPERLHNVCHYNIIFIYLLFLFGGDEL